MANLEIINKFCLGVLTRVKKYYKGMSLKRIMGKLSVNLENNFPELISFLVLSNGFSESN